MGSIVLTNPWGVRRRVFAMAFITLSWLHGWAAAQPNSATPTAPLMLDTQACEEDAPTYDEYLSHLKEVYQEEAKSAKEFGITAPTFEAMRSAVVTREEYNNRLHDSRF